MQASIAARNGAERLSVSVSVIARARLRRILLAILSVALLGAAPAASAQCISLTTLGVAYTQNFDTLSNTAGSTTNNLTIPGWFMTEGGGGARDNEQYAVDTGASTTGDTYSYGAAGSTERALGELRSGTLIPNFGACFTNNTGSTITSLAVAFTGEEWRLGTAGRTDQLNFEYSLNSTDLTTGTWTNVAALNFVTPDTATVGAKNGNAAADRTALSATINGLSVANGATFWIRWTDIDASGADDGLAVDDFSLTPQTSTTPALSINNVSLPEGNSGTTAFNFTVTLSAPPTADVTVQYATVNGTATSADNDYAPASGTLVFTAGTSTLTQTISVLVTGDTKPEADQTFTVHLSNATNATIATADGTGTILNDDITPIHDIQGNGAASPIAGSNVLTRGIVTGVKSNGFFIQAPDADVDADPNTSEGIFVFTSAAPPAAAAVGNLVQVAATVQEYIPTADPNSPSFTELVTPTVSLISAGNPLPTPVVLTTNDMIDIIDNLEKYESMRVAVVSLTAVSGTAGTVDEADATSSSNGVFYGVLTGTPRPFREPGVPVPGPLPAGSPCCVPRFDANPERLRVDSDALGGSAINVSTGAVLTNLVGPLDYAFRTYTIDTEPSSPPTVTPGMSVAPATAPIVGEITIASFNLERFYNDAADDPGAVTLTTAAYQTRLQKASLAIRNFLNAPDIIGVEEMENLLTLQTLSEQISGDALAAGQPDPQYVACLFEGNDVGGIDVGFLVKGAAATATTHHVEMITCTQYNKNSVFTNPDTSTALLNDRPPLELVATVSNAAGDSFPVTVYVNHLRSLNGQDDPGPGSNGWPNEGDRVRAKRQAQAVELANLIQTRQTNFPADHIVVLGDFNAFEFNDGYGDSMGTIAGTPAPDNQTVVPGDGSSPVSPALSNLSDTPPPAERYSYSFDGNAQSLDHILINSTLTGLTHRIEHARIDADFPESLRGDAATPARISDHDPTLLYLDALPMSKISVTKTATPNPVAAGAQITYTINVANAGQGSGGDVSLNDALPANTTFVSLSASAGWSCSTPAVGANGTVTCSIASLAPGNEGAFTLVAAVAVGTADGTSISNTATVSVAANDDGSGPLSATATVSVLTPVNGACGSDNNLVLPTAPTNLCAAGTATAVSGSGHPWSWSCNGANGGSNATCSATIATWTVNTVVSGSGGSVAAPASATVDNGMTASFTAVPDPNYSLSGASGCGASAAGNAITTAAITANCTVTVTFSANPVNGACGSDNGLTLGAAPTNLCSAGTVSAVAGNGPWTWSCQGSGGGTTASCSANATTGSIAVLGGGNPILNGDTSPNASKGTDFGNVPVGTQSAHSFTIGNPSAPAPTAIAGHGGAATVGFALPNAAGDLVISSITSSNPAFTIAGGTGTIPQGGSAVFTVTFNATVVGAQNATITIASNDTSTPTFTFAVIANAVAVTSPAAVAAPLLDAKALLLLIAALAAVGHVALRRRGSAK